MTDKKTSDQGLSNAARQLLDAQADQLPESVTKALAQARRTALAGQGAPPRQWRLRPWPVAAMGAAMAALVISVLVLRPLPPVEIVAEPIHDLEILTAQADLDLLDELEFLAWVADQWSDAG